MSFQKQAIKTERVHLQYFITHTCMKLVTFHQAEIRCIVSPYSSREQCHTNDSLGMEIKDLR